MLASATETLASGMVRTSRIAAPGGRHCGSPICTILTVHRVESACSHPPPTHWPMAWCGQAPTRQPAVGAAAARFARSSRFTGWSPGARIRPAHPDRPHRSRLRTFLTVHKVDARSSPTQLPVRRRSAGQAEARFASSAPPGRRPTGAAPAAASGVVGCFMGSGRGVGSGILSTPPAPRGWNPPGGPATRRQIGEAADRIILLVSLQGRIEASCAFPAN